MSDYNSSLPIRTETAGDVASKIVDGTINTRVLTVNADGSINITDNGGSITVDASDLDIRDLTSASDSVEVLQATHDDLNANANIQVGDTDVSNGNPVPVSDAGGSLTVDASDLDIRDLTSASDSVEVLQDTHDDLNANANIQVGNTDVSNGNPVPMSDAGGSITVDATDLDIRDLDATQDNVAISDGTNTLAINSDGSINAVVQEDVGTEVVDYDTTAAVAGGASDNHDYLVTNGGKLYQVMASGSGKMKVEVQVETGSATNVFTTKAVKFNSTANANMDFDFLKFVLVPTGARVRVIRTNRENQAQDVYSTIILVAN